MLEASDDTDRRADQSVVVLGVVVVAQALLGRRASAATRHLIWALAIVGLLLLPVLSLVVPGWTVVRLPASPPSRVVLFVPPPESDVAALATGRTETPKPIVAPASAAPPAVGRAGMSWVTVLLILYAVGLLVLLARLTSQRWSIRRLARRATPVSDPEWTGLVHECAARIGVRRTVSVLRSREQTMPVAFGTWRGAILVPAVADTWCDDRRRAVLLHELAHIARLDCLIQMLAAVACALYWIHPGVWWVARRLRLEREIACDDMVLSTGTDASSSSAPAQDDAGFVAELLKRGYERPTPDEQRLLAQQDIGPAFLDELAAQGYTQPNLAQLVRAAQHGVSFAYLREMGQLGYRFQFLDALIVQRDHGISPSFVRALRAEGVSAAAEELIRVRDHGVSPQYVSELRELGFAGLSIDSLVRARDHGVSPEYIRALNQLGSRPPLDDFIKARDHGVSAEYIRALTALGYKDLSLDDLIRLRDHGISEQFVRDAITAGNERPTVERLVAWRTQPSSADLFRRVIDRMWGANVGQFVWHVRCASAWLQQMLNGATRRCRPAEAPEETFRLRRRQQSWLLRTKIFVDTGRTAHERRRCAARGGGRDQRTNIR